MKKYFVTFSFILFFLFVTKSVFAQFPTPTLSQPPVSQNINPFDFEKQIPGVGCGVPGGKDGTDACCIVKNATICTNNISSILNVEVIGVKIIRESLGRIPIIGNIIFGVTDQCVTAEQKINDFQSKFNTSCIYGKVVTSAAGFCTCVDAEIATRSATIAQMCHQYLNNPESSDELKGEVKDCLECANKGKMWTGFGCFSLDIKVFVTEVLLTFGIGLGGIIALFCIIYSAFRIQTSQGNPEMIKKTQENLTSCIVGLILIIFSVFILRLIGVDILRIPFIK